MTLTLRSASTTTATTKGSALTHAEMDANWLHLAQSSGVEFLQSGSGATARTVQAKLRDVVSVKDFGAVGDGSTDDSAAILACVNAAAGQSVGAGTSTTGVYFPAGVYKITSSAVLTPTVSTSLKGIHFYGAGMWTSILRLSPSGSDLYFYNNVATARTQLCTFADLGFEGVAVASVSAYTDISDNAKGFRLYAASAAGSHEQGFRFTNCRLFGLHTMFETAGDNTTSENKFIGCKISHIKSVVLKTDNLQSFNHEFHGTDIEVIYGDVFQVSTNGGGAIKMYGGSVIMMSDTASDTHFFEGTGSSGATGGPFVFNGLRMELRGNTANLVSLTTAKDFNLHFNNSLIYDTGTAAKTSYCAIGSHASVHFRDCTFLEATNDVMRFNINNSGAGFGINGEIIFDTCQLPADFSDKCSLSDTYGSGLISAINCRGNATTFDGAAHFAYDFDLHGLTSGEGQVATWATSSVTDAGSPRHPQWRLKIAQIKLATDYWPDTTEHTLKLPKNALIKAIHLRKPPHASEATAVTLRVGRLDKSGTDHTTVTANWNASHSVDLNDYYYFVGDTTNERTLILYTNENPTAAIQGGFCIVEYY